MSVSRMPRARSSYRPPATSSRPLAVGTARLPARARCMSRRPVTRRSATGTRRQSGARSPCQSRRPESGAVMSGRGRPLAEKCRGRRTSRPACSAPRACRVEGGSSSRVSRRPLPLLPPSLPVRARSSGGRELCGTSSRRTSSRKVPAGAAGLPCRRLWKASAAEGRPGTTARHGARSMLSSVRRTSMAAGFRLAVARTRPAGAMRASRPRRASTAPKRMARPRSSTAMPSCGVAASCTASGAACRPVDSLRSSPSARPYADRAVSGTPAARRRHQADQKDIRAPPGSRSRACPAA